MEEDVLGRLEYRGAPTKFLDFEKQHEMSGKAKEMASLVSNT